MSTTLGGPSINRMGLYLMAHTFRHYGFMERVIRTLRHLIRLKRSKSSAPVPG